MTRPQLTSLLLAWLAQNRSAEVLDALSQYLEGDESGLAAQVVLLQARYRRNEDLFNGPAGRRISREEYERELNNIHFALTQLFPQLPAEGADIQINTPPANTGGRRQGKILYRIPRNMQLGERQRCIIRIAPAELAEALLSEKLDAEPRTVEALRIGRMMKVSLENLPGEAPFEVQMLSEHLEQPILDGEYTEWIYLVRPLLPGRHLLALKVSISELLEGYGERWKDVVVLDREIEVLSEAPEEEADFQEVPHLRVAAAGGTAAPTPAAAAPPESAVPPAEPPQPAVQPAPAPPSPPARAPRLWRAGAIAAAAVLVLAIALPQFRMAPGPGPNASEIFGAGFAQVPKGRLNMGNPRGRPDEQPVHIVTLPPFRMAKHEVTVAEFARFVAATGYQTDAERRNGSNIWVAPDSLRFGEGVNWRHDPQGRLRPPGDSLHPAVHVSWNDAQAYCAWLSQQQGRRFRLPTEAEWEYAARGGKWSDSLLTPFAGGNDPYAVAIFFGNSGGNTWPVGSKTPNALGIHDLSGNAWEWCADGYAADYYARSPGHHPKGDSTASARVGRGGGWSATRDQLVLTRRYAADPAYSDFGLGFRVVSE